MYSCCGTLSDTSVNTEKEIALAKAPIKTSDTESTGPFLSGARGLMVRGASSTLEVSYQIY